MKTSRAPRPDRHGDVIAVGAPALAVVDEDREQLEDLLAELLVAELERDGERAS
jgi:hypothetical protein